MEEDSALQEVVARAIGQVLQQAEVTVHLRLGPVSHLLDLELYKAVVLVSLVADVGVGQRRLEIVVGVEEAAVEEDSGTEVIEVVTISIVQITRLVPACSVHRCCCYYLFDFREFPQFINDCLMQTLLSIAKKLFACVMFIVLPCHTLLPTASSIPVWIRKPSSD